MKVRHVLAAGVLCMCVAAPGEAQIGGRRQQDQQQQHLPTNVTPPRPMNADRPPTLWLIAVAVLLGAGIVGTAVIPSKRGHQD